jgi:nitroreductase
MTDILETIFSRRSIRKYEDKPVEREKLTKLLQAGTAAPSACNNKPWEFVAVDDLNVMEQFRTRLLYGPYNAPAAIVVCHNPQVGKSPGCDKFWEQDCSAAIENILLAAVGLGLGTVWLGTHPNEAVISIVREIVKLPEHVTPLAVIYIGYPAENKEPRTQYDEALIHWQQYEQKI